MSLFTTLMSSVTGSFTNNSGAGALTILKGASATRSNGVANVQTALDNAKYDAGRQQIMANVQLRIEAIVNEEVVPTDTWEKVAGYLALTGQPFTYTVSNAGEIEVNEQNVDNLSSLPVASQSKMRDALTRLDEVRAQVDETVTKANLRVRLIDAVNRVSQMELHSPPSALWETEFQTIKSTGRPVMIGLNADGEVRAINQLESNFDYVEDPDKRLILQEAGRKLTNILNGTATATETWQYEALGNQIEGDDYFLDVDDNNEVVIRRNTEKRRSATNFFAQFHANAGTDYHVIPEFLKTENTNIFKASWEEQAAAFIQAKTPFFLDLQGDTIVARQTNFVNMRRLDLLDAAGSYRQQTAQALVNLIT